MQRVLRKRILRDLKENLLRYLALGAIIVLCMYLVISLIGTAETMIRGSDILGEENHVEDGQFSMFLPMTEQQKQKITDAGVELEEHFYLDYMVEDGSTLRVFENREMIDLYAAVEGRSAEKDNEVALERRYCEEHDIHIGDTFIIGGKELEIVGIGCTPDYDAPLKEYTDASVDSTQFGTVFVTDGLYKTLLSEGNSTKTEEYVYSYLLNDGMTDDELREYLEDIVISPEEVSDAYFLNYYMEQTADKRELEDGIEDLVEGSRELKEGIDTLVENKTGIALLDKGLYDTSEGANALYEGVLELQEGTDELIDEYFAYEVMSLKSFVKAEDNPRIKAAADDQVINKLVGIMAGIIVIVLFAYVLSVFVVYGIEKEITTIGALYSLGVRRNELIKHYLCLPIAVAFVASVIGSVLGFCSIGGSTIAGSCYDYFSIPNMEPILPPYLLVYGLVMPPLMATVVNYIVIKSKLNKPALAMLRNEKKIKVAKHINLGKLGFVGTFQIRQMMREARTSLTVLGGMFVSLLILMLGLNCYVMCKNISVNNKTDTKFEYMYTLKYPESAAPEGGYEALSQMVKKENLGYNLDVTILGITKENPFFEVEMLESKSDITISSAMAQKFNLKKGDVFTVYNEDEKMHYAFTVCGITEYSAGLYIFMDIVQMRDMLGENDKYYNVLFSEEELDIEPERIYGITTKADIEKAADVFINQMQGMISMLTFFSVVIFALVMYLMIKVMIDRSAFHISMVKVFGYRVNEIKKLYLNGNFYVIALGALICIPLSKKLMDMLYPAMVANISCGMDIEFPLTMYAIIYVGIILVYLVINQFLVCRLNKVNLAEVLKNRE